MKSGTFREISLVDFVLGIFSGQKDEEKKDIPDPKHKEDDKGPDKKDEEERPLTLKR